MFSQFNCLARVLPSRMNNSLQHHGDSLKETRVHADTPQERISRNVRPWEKKKERKARTGARSVKGPSGRRRPPISTVAYSSYNMSALTAAAGGTQRSLVR